MKKSSGSARKCVVCGKSCGKPAALDLFSGAGGAARGLQMAGFCVLGIDHKPQPRYAGCRFHQADAMEFPLEGFAFIWASPPCQAYSITRLQHPNKKHPELYEAIRERLRATQAVWIIENVMGAPAGHAIVLCGAQFGLRVYRHRCFESNLLLLAPPHQPHYVKCAKQGRPATPDQFVTVTGNCSGVAQARLAMGIDWMVRDELSQAVPPAYSEFLGKQVIEQVKLF